MASRHQSDANCVDRDDGVDGGWVRVRGAEGDKLSEERGNTTWSRWRRVFGHHGPRGLSASVGGGRRGNGGDDHFGGRLQAGCFSFVDETGEAVGREAMTTQLPPDDAAQALVAGC